MARRAATRVACCLFMLCVLPNHLIAGDEPAALELTLSLDKPVVTVGGAVKLREMIAASTKLDFSVVIHESTLIGQYDESTDRLSNLPSRLYETRTFEIPRDFPELPMGLSMYHGMTYRVKAPGLKGTEFEFRPKRPGVYLITASWMVKGTFGEKITGPPIVLTVRPKPPAK